uniref:HepT-like ribonuclease domain-containing protein n=2 Tax=Parabacteroides distasonis TaxID=823 RepID=UPI00402947C7
MFDTELALDTLSQIKDTLSMIMARTSHIHKVDDFYMNESGMILLDSVCMKLVAVGEAIKNLDKITNKELLLKYPAVNWKDIKGMRDIIVHHYFDIDASVILYCLQKEVPRVLMKVPLLTRLSCTLI